MGGTKSGKHVAFDAAVKAIKEYGPGLAGSAGRAAWKMGTSNSRKLWADHVNGRGSNTSQKAKKIQVQKKRGRGSSGPGRSGGFITTRKMKKTKRSRAARRGIVYTKEVGGKTTSADCVYIGHITCPVTLMKANAFRALFKHLMEQTGLEVSDIDENLQMGAGNEVQIFYTRLPGELLSVAAYTIPVGGLTSVELLTQWAMGPLMAWNVDNSAGQSTQFALLRYHKTTFSDTVSTPVDVSMKQMRVTFQSKSALKIQNRTVNAAANTEADDVNNVPLFGTSYEGNSTGAIYCRRPTAGGAQPVFIGSATRGNILGDVVGNNEPNEPPEPETFDKVTRTGKLKIEPGEIKTSVMTYNGTMWFNDFWLRINPTVTNSSGTIRKHIGKFRFFAIEKMLHFAAADSEIVTVYEINLDMVTTVSFRRSFQAIRKFEAERDVDQ
jgi:hypothetical protein